MRLERPEATKMEMTEAKAAVMVTVVKGGEKKHIRCHSAEAQRQCQKPRTLRCESQTARWLASPK